MPRIGRIGEGRATMVVRDEGPGEAEAVRALIEAAFRSAPHGPGGEGAIVDALRDEGALTLSLVALHGGRIAGHVAFSAVLVNGSECGWYGLGPIAVAPDRQGRGLGSALVRAGTRRLAALGTGGCVVLGDPRFYGRFGFRHDPGLRPGFDTGSGAPAGMVGDPNFQVMAFRSPVPSGAVTYHPAFDADAIPGRSAARE